MAGNVSQSSDMKWFTDVKEVYLHRDPVDFRKSINGLSIIVEEAMNLSPYREAVFVFCNRRRDKLKILCWDHTGFVLWYKRLEKAKFKWPRKHNNDVIILSNEELDWLLRGFDLQAMAPHQILQFTSAF